MNMDHDAVVSESYRVDLKAEYHAFKDAVLAEL